MIVTRCRWASTARNLRGGGAFAASERATAAATITCSSIAEIARHEACQPFLRETSQLSHACPRENGHSEADTMQGDHEHMNPRPASPRLRRVLPLAVALAIGAAAGAGAYALTSHSSGTPSASARGRAGPAAPRPPRPSTRSRSSTSRTRRASSTSPSSRRSSGSSSGGFPFGNPGGSQKQEAEGTGFEIDTKGDILTAEHVVAGATSIKVTFQDGSTAKATLVGSPTSRPTRP